MSTYFPNQCHSESQTKTPIIKYSHWIFHYIQNNKTHIRYDESNYHHCEHSETIQSSIMTGFFTAFRMTRNCHGILLPSHGEQSESIQKVVTTRSPHLRFTMTKIV